MVADKKIDDENNNQRRQVAHGFDIGPADQPEKHDLGGTTDSHDGSEQYSQEGAEYAEPNGVKQTPHQNIGHPFSAVIIKAVQKLGDFLPVPVVVERDLHPIVDGDARDQKQRTEYQVRFF